ncbi:MAG: tyrosine-type recombinase/integrase [Candidatus Dormibacteria bacterium]
MKGNAGGVAVARQPRFQEHFRRVAPTLSAPWRIAAAPVFPAEGPSLPEAAELFWRGCQSRRTEAEYRQCLLRFAAFAARRRVFRCAQLEPALLLAFQASQNSLAPSTRRHRAFVLRLFLRQLESANWCAGGLSQELFIPRLPRQYPRPGIPLLEQRRLLQGAADARSRALLWLLLATGARIGELLGASWADWQGDVLFLSGKTGTRAVPLSDPCRAALAEYLGQRGRYRPDAPLLMSRQGRLSRRQVGSLLRSCCQRAGLAPLSPHRLRHAAAARWLSHGIPVVVVAQMLGHARPSTTLDHYSSATATELLNGLTDDPLWTLEEPVGEAAPGD